jgi:3-isopropylmalate/(R)-2-methylmalate dehydratase large subunit
VTVYPDCVLLDDASAAEVVSAHRALDRVAVKRAERFLWVPGASDSEVDPAPLVEFARRHRLPLPFDPYHAGRLSTVAGEVGAVGSDDVVVSMNPEAGALGGLGAVVMKTDAASLSGLMIGRPVDVAVPPTRVVHVTGRLPRWASAFDLALAVLDAVGSEVAMLELRGDTLVNLPVPERLELCGALACAGWPALVPPDEATALWLQARRPGAPGAKLPAEGDAPLPLTTAEEPDLELNAAKAVPRVLLGGWSGRRVRPEDDSRPVGVVVLGGPLESLRAAALTLRERNVRPGLQLCVLPGSQRTLLHAIEEGLAADLVRAGALLLPPGSRPPVPRSGQQRLSTLPESRDATLCSPGVAAASAAMGVLTHPESLNRMRREGRRRA